MRAEHSTQVSTSWGIVSFCTIVAHTTHLELVHDGHNLILEGLVRDLPAAEVDLIADKDDGDIDAELAEVW